MYNLYHSADSSIVKACRLKQKSERYTIVAADDKIISETVEKKRKRETTENDIGFLNKSKEQAGDSEMDSTTKHDVLSGLPDDIILKIGSWLNIKSKAHLSLTGKFFRDTFQEHLREEAYKKLLQAVVDDEQQTVKTILDGNPGLLTPELSLGESTNENITIQSQLTWQIFYAENPLVMAVARNQVAMVEILLPYFDKLTNGREAAEKQWQQAESIIKEQKRPSADFFDDLINTIINQSAEEVKQTLQEFRRKVLPEKAVKLEEYYNVEQLLLSAYQAFDNKVDNLQYCDQRRSFTVNVLGFCQSLLSRKDAEVFCQGLYGVVDDYEAISERARRLEVNISGVVFYRSNSDLSSGLGFDYLVNLGGWRPGPTDIIVKSYVKQKQQTMESLNSSYFGSVANSASFQRQPEGSCHSNSSNANTCSHK